MSLQEKVFFGTSPGHYRSIDQIGSRDICPLFRTLSTIVFAHLQVLYRHSFITLYGVNRVHKYLFANWLKRSILRMIKMHTFLNCYIVIAFDVNIMFFLLPFFFLLLLLNYFLCYFVSFFFVPWAQSTTFANTVMCMHTHPDRDRYIDK